MPHSAQRTPTRRLELASLTRAKEYFPPAIPQGCSDDDFPWNRDESKGDTKYQFVVHAELNAILNASGKNLFGSTVYVALFPCNECAKAIIQSGIKEVVYLSDKYHDTPSTVASRKMLNAAGVKLTQIKPTKAQIILNFEE